MHPRPNDDEAPLWPGTRPGAAGGSPTSGDQRSGSVDCSSPWEAGTFLRRRFRPAVVALDIGLTRLHDLRHTFASLASREASSAQVAKWMGHASDVITREVYTHLFDKDSVACAARLAAGGRPTASRSVASVTPIARRG